MARLFQPHLAPADADGATRRDDAQPAADDDVALGWECANPALQFERWEPALPSQQPSEAGY